MISTPIRFRPALFCMLLAGTAFGLVGCGGEPEPEAQAETEAAAEPAARPAPIRRPGTDPSMATGPQDVAVPSSTDARYTYVPKVQGQLEQDGTGLEMMVDGSSEAAFADSLARIAESTSGEQYTSLERSVRFLTTFDPSILGDPAKMRQTVDGMTAQEIIEKANELSAARYSRHNRTRDPDAG